MDREKARNDSTRDIFLVLMRVRGKVCFTKSAKYRALTGILHEGCDKGVSRERVPKDGKFRATKRIGRPHI